MLYINRIHWCSVPLPFRDEGWSADVIVAFPGHTHLISGVADLLFIDAPIFFWGGGLFGPCFVTQLFCNHIALLQLSSRSNMAVDTLCLFLTVTWVVCDVCFGMSYIQIIPYLFIVQQSDPFTEVDHNNILYTCHCKLI